MQDVKIYKNNTMYTIKLKKVRENAILPERISKGSAAYDAIMPED